MKTAVSSLILSALALSSCAYVQTHKNVRESFHTYEGYSVDQPLQLFSTGNGWYVAVRPETMRLHYPMLHDSAFLDIVQDPVYRSTGKYGPTCYYRVSAGTAHVLQRQDGYYTLESLMDELRTLNPQPVKKLPAGAARQAILAHVEPGQGGTIPAGTERKPQKTPLAGQVLSVLDLLCVDAPLTVLYNVAIPVAAPFVFFHNFLKEQ